MDADGDFDARAVGKDGHCFLVLVVLRFRVAGFSAGCGWRYREEKKDRIINEKDGERKER